MKKCEHNGISYINERTLGGGKGKERKGRRKTGKEREGEVKGKGRNEKELDIISLTFLFMSPSILATVNRVTIPAISLLAP